MSNTFILRAASKPVEKLPRLDRSQIVRCIVDAMEVQYEKEGEDGDFQDAYRHLLKDASYQEVLEEYEKWCPKEYKKLVLRKPT